MASRFAWTRGEDEALRQAVPECAFDFDAVSRVMNSRGAYSLSPNDCRMRFAALHGLTSNEDNEETEDTGDDSDGDEDKPIEWSLEIDRMLVDATVAESYDFVAVGEVLGQRLGRKHPVPAKLCRLRFAAVDRNMLIDPEPKIPVTEMAKPAPPPEKKPSFGLVEGRGDEGPSSGRFGGDSSVTLALPSEEVMRELSVAFDNRLQHDTDLIDTKSDSESFRGGIAPSSATGTLQPSSSNASSSASGEPSELQKVLDFLENHSNTDKGEESFVDGADYSFEDLFGIPETMLDRSVAVPPPSLSESTGGKKEEYESLIVDRGHFDLSDPRYAATFDRVAKAIGALDMRE